MLAKVKVVDAQKSFESKKGNKTQRARVRLEDGSKIDAILVAQDRELRDDEEVTLELSFREAFAKIAA